MPKVFKVAKAFLSTEADKKTPQVVNTQGGPMHKYMVQFEDQSIPGWVSILRKPDSVEVAEGDEFYGVLEENQWGKPQFTRMQVPQNVQLNKGSAPAAQKPAGTGGNNDFETEVNEKLDFLITLMENFLESQGATIPKREVSNSNTEDDGTKPIDLSEIPY